MPVVVTEGRRIELQGIVQGVGARPWICRLARELGVTGRVWNHARGVTVEAFGPSAALDALLRALAETAPPAAVVAAVRTAPIPVEHLDGFTIVGSVADSERRVSIPADLATCDACAAEIVDPRNRRFRYPFTNCTNCGPRFTIATDVPYDRAATTMAPFVMCEPCQREYDDPADRRFHAQPNACPSCGPRLMAVAPDGHRIETPDAIRFAAGELRAGRIVAVKGIGGFHLACDATSDAAVATLRERKRRDEKPLAVMVRDVAAASDVAEIGPEALRLLQSVERPIVLVARRATTPIAASVAPRNPLIGLMLPYTPLHHLLLADAGMPLVMTSANLSEEPIVYRNDEALQRLGGIADVLLIHDREIVTRCDDSVAAVIAGGPVLLRRSRGFVPRAIPLRRRVAVPVLACGALLKNTFCLAHRNQAWFGPHIGDLENADTFEAYHDAIARMERFLGVRGEIVAHDLHPDYLSTRYALARDPLATGVQHHHAHVASAMAEHGLDGPVVGVAFDGTGYGLDGTAWGGEILVGDADTVDRVATFRPIPLAGGDAAIRHPWRIALALLTDAFGDSDCVRRLPVFASLAPSDVLGVQRLLASRVNTPLARGVGRYFDGFGALVLAHPHARYEGQIAFALNMVADGTERRQYEYDVHRSGVIPEIDFQPVVQMAMADLLGGAPTPAIAARFHNSVIAATGALAAEAARSVSTTRRVPIVLTGGCFQNALLAEGVRELLAPRHDVFLHHGVPPGDGGIALGQAVVAAARTRS